MSERLSKIQIETFLAAEPKLGSHSWTERDGKLFISLSFPDFVGAFAFMTAVALIAEKSNHHPDWTNVYNRVDIALVTHSAGGISQKDIDLAREIARIYSRAKAA